jgi:periplasmic protein TonB
MPHLRGPLEAQSAHLETSWTQAARLATPQESPLAPALPTEELAPTLPEESEWEPEWEPPTVDPRPARGVSPPLPDLTAARAFRTFTKQPQQKPKKAQPKRIRKTRPAPRAVRRTVERRVANYDPAPARPPRQPVLSAPRVKKQPRVSLPSRCRRRGHRGKVRLLLEVDALGVVKSSRVASSAGCGRLDEAARKAGLDYRFRPGTRDGRASNWLVYVEIQFGPTS